MPLIKLETHIAAIESMMKQLDVLELTTDSPVLNHCLSLEDMGELGNGIEAIRRNLNNAKAWAVEQYNTQVLQLSYTTNKGDFARFHGTKDELRKFWNSSKDNMKYVEIYYNYSRAPICGDKAVGIFLSTN
ncbi:hypothetical protein RaK2_00276 [Klebsiella phage vB_KleM_RaK2]|uniref:Uncharacterized protein n=1 Tax=Klebsiella phage vB_KleM_RaK2 TaxID=1147094 RepID=H6X483_9CAUD|nr:hypothetical protein F403_gp259 [Klebsiella phage vB_KleM_RaK2]AFA44549.1 hypothetical protein RaK2_00276 [Klebsiella phage vB_KleM_RaK2]